MAKVLKLHVVENGVDTAIDEARHAGFDMVFIIGLRLDDSLETASNVDVGTALLMMERAKHFLLFED